MHKHGALSLNVNEYILESANNYVGLVITLMETLSV